MPRLRETSYGSVAFARVARNERAIVAIAGGGPRARLRRLRAGELERALYRRRVPAIDAALTSSPEGRMIAEHLAIREGRRYRHRDAQGVLVLPATLAEYLRGRHRQAVRTNVSRARRVGITVRVEHHARWHPGVGDFRVDHITPGPIERFSAYDADGSLAADSVLSVDDHVALLHGLVSTVTDARWLLHTAIVEHLCGRCGLLLANGGAVYRESYGSHHFQRLLGYEIRRIEVGRAACGPARTAHAPSDGWAHAPTRTASELWT